MATEQSKGSTPEGTGPLTIHGAQDAIESLLAADEAGTQAGDDGQQPADDASTEEHRGEGNPAEGQKPEDGEETPESEDEAESDSDEEKSDEVHEELPDDTKVTVDGKEVTLHELKRGFLREQDYTRKTQALAEQRRQLEATVGQEAGALRAEREQLAQALAQVQTYMQELMPAEPNWAELYQRNPAEYAAQRELWRSWQEQLRGMEAQRQQLSQREQAERMQQLQRTIQEEKARLLTAVPEWSKPEVAQAEKQKLIEWGQKVGYSPEELNSVLDHRALVVARKAMLYDEMMAKQKAMRPAAPAVKVKPAMPGSAATKPSRASEIARSKQRLAQTGRVQDAAAVIESLLGD